MTAKKFVLFFVFIVVGYALINRYVFYEILTDKSRLTVDPSKRTIIFGASHGRFAINPNYFQQVENLCVKGEDLIFSHGKLALLNEFGSNISNIIITISPSTFSQAREENNKRRDDFLNKILKYEYLSNTQIIKELTTHEGFEERRRNKYTFGLIPPSNTEFKYIALSLFGMDLQTSHPGWGEYEPVTGSYLRDNITLDRIDEHYFYNNEVLDMSDNQVKYIKEIAHLCLQSNINLTVIRTPEHRTYREKIPKQCSEDFEALMSELTNSLNVRFFDFSKRDLDDKCFFDCDHLNEKGSLIFSDLLKSEIEFLF